ncbi:MAG: hypothetical protein Q8O55_01450 [Dehalococcoidales bacterium]|nr:hypothetical protein [Dehalococcoidales bacterium]
MAVVSSMPPSLSFKRSAQSGSKVMTAAWQVVYTENTAVSLMAYLFAGAEINLSPMAAGDTINVRIRKILVPGGAWVIHDQVAYNNAQPVTHPSVHINPIPDVYGCEISMQQTAVAVALLQIEFEAYDAKRLGLA